MVMKVSEPLLDLNLSRRDLCALFSAMMSTFDSIPLLAEKGITRK